MRHRATGGILAFTAASLILTAFTLARPAVEQATPPASSDAQYLFSYFTGNGEDGLHLAHSRDGLTWEPLNGGKSYLQPRVGTKLMRDPSILRGPDGAFHMVWTTGWWDRGIGVAHSRDLVNWSDQQFLPVMAHEPEAVNCWAPELFYDPATTQYLIFWSTTIHGKFAETADSGDPKNDKRLNHRVYYVTTKDFRSFSDTKLLYDGGFNVIDGVMVKDADRYVLIVKDETLRPTPKKHLRIATSDRATGPFGKASDPVTPDWVEGPSVLKVGDAWMVYYDEYTRKKYGAIRSTDLKSWTIVSEKVHFPVDARHGTAFAVPAGIANPLLKAGSAARP